MSIIHPRDVRTLVLTRSTEGFSAPLASLYSVISAGPYVIRLLYELRTPDYYPWVGFPTLYIAYLLYSSKLLRLFGVRVSAQSAFVEQDTGFEPALPVWKTGVLAADTNPA